MTDLDLARRAVACRHWRWMPGMADQYGDRVTLVTNGGRLVTTGTLVDDGTLGAFARDSESPDDMHPPDLSDPATIGCLLQLVRDAWRDPAAHCLHDRWADRWAVSVRWLDLPDARAWAPTEAAALVAALEAAP
jgi:hypothetical protein